MRKIFFERSNKWGKRILKVEKQRKYHCNIKKKQNTNFLMGKFVNAINGFIFRFILQLKINILKTPWNLKRIWQNEYGTEWCRCGAIPDLLQAKHLFNIWRRNVGLIKERNNNIANINIEAFHREKNLTFFTIRAYKKLKIKGKYSKSHSHFKCNYRPAI
jgi:hypothetical protein